MNTKHIILASSSPRRQELVKLLNIPFAVQTSDTDENISAENAEDLVTALALKKANAVFNLLNKENIKNTAGDYFRSGSYAIIGADTVVSVGGRVLGKPVDRNDAACMLKMISGKSHEVYTGVAIIFSDGSIENFAECTRVFVSPLTENEIDCYIDTNEPFDKAGSYAIQGKFSPFIEKINGDYNNVVGFPVSRIYNALKKH